MAAQQRCGRALIVEDDPAIRKLLQKILLRSGIEIDTVQDGKTALEKISKATTTSWCSTSWCPRSTASRLSNT